MSAWTASRATSDSGPSSSCAATTATSPASTAACTAAALPCTHALSARSALSRTSPGAASRSRSGRSRWKKPAWRACSCASAMPSTTPSSTPSAASTPPPAGPPRSITTSLGTAPISSSARLVFSSSIRAPSRRRAARAAGSPSGGSSCSTSSGRPPPVAMADAMERLSGASPSVDRLVSVAAASAATFFDLSARQATRIRGAPSRPSSDRQPGSSAAATPAASMADALTFAGASRWPRTPTSVCSPPRSSSSAAAVLEPCSSVHRQVAAASAAARSGGLDEKPPSSSGSTASMAPASLARWPASGRSAAIRPTVAAAEMAASVAAPRASTCTSAGSACALSSASAHEASTAIVASAAAAGLATLRGTAGASSRSSRGAPPAATIASRAGGWPHSERVISRSACCRSTAPPPAAARHAMIFCGPAALTNWSSRRGWCIWWAVSALKTRVRSSTPRSEKGASSRAAILGRPPAAESAPCMSSSRAHSDPIASAALTATFS
mmetsp:Transcript_884/g.2937  ORF Transcript_884/g.2937 Transcript_884/m.2937 type:complete len:499 (-) Transcript_884:513-2009(-)